MKLDVKIANFRGGMKGKYGQFREDIKDSFLHAENLIQERDGSLRSRPAFKAQTDIQLLPYDHTLSFVWGGDTYTVVYDPLMELTLMKDHPNNIRTTRNYDPSEPELTLLWDKPRSEFGSTFESRYDLIAQLKRDQATAGNSQAGFETWINDARALFQFGRNKDLYNLQASAYNIKQLREYTALAIRLFISRGSAVPNFPIRIPTELPHNRTLSLWLQQRREDMVSNTLIQLIYKRDAANPVNYSRFLIYKNSKLISTSLYRPLSSTQPGYYDEIESPLNATVGTLRDGSFRDQFKGEVNTLSYRAEVASTIDHVVLTDDQGKLPTLVIDMSKADSDIVQAYDIRIPWLSTRDVSSRKEIYLRYIQQSYLTQEEFDNALKTEESGVMVVGFGKPPLPAGDTDPYVYNSDRTTSQSIIDGIAEGLSGDNSISVEGQQNRSGTVYRAEYKVTEAYQRGANDGDTSTNNHAPISDITSEGIENVPVNQVSYMYVRHDDGEVEDTVKDLGPDQVTLNPFWVETFEERPDQEVFYAFVKKHTFNPLYGFNQNNENARTYFGQRDDPETKQDYSASDQLNQRNASIRMNSAAVGGGVISTDVPNFEFIGFYMKTFMMWGWRMKIDNDITAFHRNQWVTYFPMPISPMYQTHLQYPFITDFVDPTVALLFGRVGGNVFDRWQRYIRDIFVHIPPDSVTGTSLEFIEEDNLNYVVASDQVSVQALGVKQQITTIGLQHPSVEFPTRIIRKNELCNIEEFFTGAVATQGRLALSGLPNLLCVTNNTGAGDGLFNFDYYGNFAASPEEPQLNLGYVQPLVIEEDSRILYLILNTQGQVVVGTTRGDITFAVLTKNNIINGVFVRQLTEEGSIPVSIFTARYQIFRRGKEIFLTQASEEYQRTRYISVANDLQDFLDGRIDQIAALQSHGRLVARSGTKVFIGMVDPEGKVTWTEISTGLPIRSISADDDILILHDSAGIKQLDLSETTDIEDNAPLSLTLLAPLAYACKKQDFSPAKLDTFHIQNGYILGQFKGDIIVGTEQILNAGSHYRRDAIPLYKMSGKNWQDSIKFTFKGRKIILHTAFFEVGDS